MPRVVALFALGVAVLPLNAQHRQRSAQDLLNHALYLAELYNWADAGPEFSQAEKMFVAAGVLKPGLRGASMNRLSVRFLLLLVGLPSAAAGQFYAGALGGLATLSADARSVIKPETV